MKQIILMSIRPEWYGLIEELKKTYEVRKDPLPEGAVVYIYLTKRWHKVLEKLFPKLKGKLGKVVAKFIVGKVEKYEIEWFPVGNDRDCYQSLNRVDTFDDEEDLYTIISNEQPSFDFNTEYIKGSCLSFDELGKYATNNKGGIGRFATLEITHLEIFDKPRELGEYKKKDISEAMTHWEWERATGCQAPCPADVYRITHAHQSYMEAWVEE